MSYAHNFVLAALNDKTAPTDKTGQLRHANTAVMYRDRIFKSKSVVSLAVLSVILIGVFVVITLSFLAMCISPGNIVNSINSLYVTVAAAVFVLGVVHIMSRYLTQVPWKVPVINGIDIANVQPHISPSTPDKPPGKSPFGKPAPPGV
jgi:hypothetical protein